MGLSKQSFVPVYYQLAEDISRKIKSGELKPGDMLPSEAQLCAQYNISRMTVRRGLSLLAEAGYLESVQGKGNFVARPRLDRLLLQFSGVGGTGEDIKSRLLGADIVPAPESVAERLGVKPGSRLVYIRRLFLSNRQPLLYDRKYLPYTKGKPILETGIEYAELPEIVERHTDIMPVKSELVVTAQALEAEEAGLLEAKKGDPAMCIEQTVYALDNRPIGWGLVVCHSDRYRLKAVSYPF
ncbi:MAG: GntR family transcriptional regulator [Clostridia bacterium]|nr:GntR family transcriptional regulator [Clostridia bacterium]